MYEVIQKSKTVKKPDKKSIQKKHETKSMSFYVAPIQRLKTDEIGQVIDEIQDIEEIEVLISGLEKEKKINIIRKVILKLLPKGMTIAKIDVAGAVELIRNDKAAAVVTITSVFEEEVEMVRKKAAKGQRPEMEIPEANQDDDWKHKKGEIPFTKIRIGPRDRNMTFRIKFASRELEELGSMGRERRTNKNLILFAHGRQDTTVKEEMMVGGRNLAFTIPVGAGMDRAVANKTLFQKLSQNMEKEPNIFRTLHMLPLYIGPHIQKEAQELMELTYDVPKTFDMAVLSGIRISMGADAKSRADYKDQFTRIFEQQTLEEALEQCGALLMQSEKMLETCGALLKTSEEWMRVGRSRPEIEELLIRCKMFFSQIDGIHGICNDLLSQCEHIIGSPLIGQQVPSIFSKYENFLIAACRSPWLTEAGSMGASGKSIIPIPNILYTSRSKEVKYPEEPK